MKVLLWIKRTTHLNYGWVLVLFGVIIRLALWPLNQGAMRTSLKMQRLQPELQALQKKYTDDPRKQQEAIMPSPARRIGTSVSFLPLTRIPVVRSSGVSTGAASRGSSLVASYAINVAISSTNSLKILVGVVRARRSETLCCTSGCETIRSVGYAGVVSMGQKLLTSRP